MKNQDEKGKVRGKILARAQILLAGRFGSRLTASLHT